MGGLRRGLARRVFASFFALYHAALPDDAEALVLGVVLAIAGTIGDLFESLVKRDMR